MRLVLLTVGALAVCGCEKSAQEAPVPESAEQAAPSEDRFEVPRQTAPADERPVEVAEPPPTGEAQPSVLPLPTGAAAQIPFDAPEASAALIQRRFYCFHQDPDPGDVPKLWSVISARGWMGAGFTQAQVSGLVTVVLEKHPEQMTAWLKAADASLPLEERGVVWRGIWNADIPGTEDALRAHAEQVDDDEARDFIRQMVRQPKWSMLEGDVQHALDAHRLIGALVGTGDDVHLARVIQTMEFAFPSRASRHPMQQINAGTNAQHSLAAVCAMNDELLQKVRKLHEETEGEMGIMLEDVILSAEAQRPADQ